MINYFGYIYKTTDLLTGLIYVGKRALSYFDPNYYGSGKRIKLIIKKCKREHISLSTRFKVEQIDFALNLVELNSKEQYWIKVLDCKNPDVGYNIGDGGESNIIPGTKRDKSVGKKITETFAHKVAANNGIEWHWFDEDAVPDGWIIGELPAKADEYKIRGAKASKTKQGFKLFNDGIRNYFIDPKSDLAATLYPGTVQDSRSYNRGKICITDGKHRKYIFPDMVIQDGWWKGDFVDYSKINHNNVSGKLWINNGLIEKYISKELPLPPGFNYGRKKKS